MFMWVYREISNTDMVYVICESRDIALPKQKKKEKFWVFDKKKE